MYTDYNIVVTDQVPELYQNYILLPDCSYSNVTGDMIKNVRQMWL